MGMARRCHVFWVPRGRLGGCRAHAFDFSPACAAGMAGHSKETGGELVSRPVRLLVSALVQVPAVVGWLRRGARSRWGLRRPACRASGRCCSMSWRIRRHDYRSTFCRVWPSPCCSIIRRQVGVGLSAPSANSVATIWPCRSPAMRSRTRALAQLVASPRAPHCRGRRERRISGNRIARLLGHSAGPAPAWSGRDHRRGPPDGSGYGLFGQSADPPRFAVASIKRDPLPYRFHGRPDGSGYRSGASLSRNARAFLIKRVYAVKIFKW